MAITATVISDDLQSNGVTRNVLIRLDDDVDSSEEFISDQINISQDIQVWADTRAASREAQKAELELSANFEVVRDGGHPLNDPRISLLRNTEAVWLEYCCKGSSNQRFETAADFAHIHQDLTNQQIVDATGLTQQQRQAWSGDAQSYANAKQAYMTDHTDDPVYFFEGFPEN